MDGRKGHGMKESLTKAADRNRARRLSLHGREFFAIPEKRGA